MITSRVHVHGTKTNTTRKCSILVGMVKYIGGHGRSHGKKKWSKKAE
jgi:hypothetical protein